MSNKKVTHARVKYIDKGEGQFLPIDKIVEFKINRPSNSKDFNPKQIYTGLWMDDEDETNEEIPVGIQISHLVCGLKELEKLLTKRSIFAPLDHSVIIEYKLKASKNQLMVNADNEEEKEEKKKDKEIAAKAAAAEKKLQKSIFSQKLKNFMAFDDLDDLDISTDDAKNSYEMEQNQKEILDDSSQEVSEKTDNTKVESVKVDQGSQETKLTNQNFMNMDNLEVDSEDEEKSTSACNELEDDLENLDPLGDHEIHNHEKKITSKSEAQKDDVVASVCESEATQQVNTIKNASFSDKNDEKIEANSNKNSNKNNYSNKNIEDSDNNRLKESNEKLKREITNLKKNFKILKAKVDNLEKIYQEVQRKTRKDQREAVPGTSKSIETGYASDTEATNSSMITSTPKTIKSPESPLKNYRLVSDKFKKKLFPAPEDHTSKKPKLDVSDAADFKKLSEHMIKGQKVMKISLGNGLLIRVENWENALAKNTVSLFSKAILRNIYSPSELAERSVSGDPNCKTPRGKHSRKQMSPHKHKALKRCLKYYLQKKTIHKPGTKTYNMEVEKINRYITEEINDVIKKIRKQNAEEVNDIIKNIKKIKQDDRKEDRSKSRENKETEQHRHKQQNKNREKSSDGDESMDSTENEETKPNSSQETSDNGEDE